MSYLEIICMLYEFKSGLLGSKFPKGTKKTLSSVSTLKTMKFVNYNLILLKRQAMFDAYLVSICINY